MWVMNAFAHTCKVHTFANVRNRYASLWPWSIVFTFPFPFPPFPPSLPPSSHLSKVLSISHHSVHTADVAAADSDNVADDDCEVRTLVKEVDRRQASPTDNNRKVYVIVRLATVPADKRATYVELGLQMFSVAG